MKINKNKYILVEDVYSIPRYSLKDRIKKILSEIKCGRHSGFAWCCVLWFILPWKLLIKYGKWNNNSIFYHRWMDVRQPISDMPDLRVKGIYTKPNNTGYRINDFSYTRVKDWGMIPCPLHLLLRKRNTVLTCWCNGSWTEEAKTRALKEYPKVCAKK